jgi:type IV pilus assembly protein PilW
MNNIANIINSSLVKVRRSAGFSLIELMIALALGILLAIGLVTVLGATNKTNRVQESMARMQENGRYAMTRLNADLRMAARQTFSVSGFFVPPLNAGTPVAPNSTNTPDGILNASIAPTVYVDVLPKAGVNFPGMDAPISPPTNWPAGTPWPLTPKFFIQGYECGTPPCVPTEPASLPAAGIAATNRVPNADILTMRYLDSDGWSLFRGELQPNTTAGVPGACTGGPLLDIQVTPATGATPGPTFNFATNDLALLVVGSSAYIFKVQVNGNDLLPINVVGGGTIPCVAGASSSGTTGTEATIYNFSHDFITVTYYLQLDTDQGDTTRLIPSLYRQQSTIFAAGVPQQIVQGVEQLNFLYGFANADSKVGYLTADAVTAASTTASCPPEPYLYQNTQKANGTIAQVETDCLWAGVKSIEAHVLVDSVNNMYDITAPDMGYQYSDGISALGYDASTAPPANQSSGIPFGKMMRREFITLNSVRNYNP